MLGKCCDDAHDVVEVGEKELGEGSELFGRDGLLAG